MPDTVNDQLRVAIISDSEHQRVGLSSLLQNSGLQVVASRTFEEHRIGVVDPDEADVLLLDLDDTIDYDLGFLDEVLESELPVLFNDGATEHVGVHDASSKWAKNLVSKLNLLVEEARIAARKKTDEAQTGDVSELSAGDAASGPDMLLETDSIEDYTEEFNESVVESEEALRRTDSAATPVYIPSSCARQVWVLGSSIGGPQAIKRFLAMLPTNLPVAYVLAQHIGAGFISLLAKQLNRATGLQVTVAEDGHLLRHRELVITPVNKRVQISKTGHIKLTPAKSGSVYTPCIDDVMIDLAVRYGPRCGALIFSGMGMDGVRGCSVIASRGGTIYAQEPHSCVVSSMPDSTRRAGVVSYSGTPEELAMQMGNHFDI